MNQPEMENYNQQPSQAELPEVYAASVFGFVPVIVTKELLQKIREGDEERQKRKNDKNNKPPKPPRRPNAKIGGIAMQHP